MRNVFPIAALIACPMMLVGQTAAELVAKNLEARGGVEKIKAIKTLKMTARLQQGAFTAQITRTAMTPNSDSVA